MSHLQLPLSFAKGLLQLLHAVHFSPERLQLALQLPDLLLSDGVGLLGLDLQTGHLSLGVVHPLPQQQNVLTVPAETHERGKQ